MQNYIKRITNLNKTQKDVTRLSVRTDNNLAKEKKICAINIYS